MKVRELLEALQGVDPELEVVLLYEDNPIITEAEVFEDDFATKFMLVAESLL